MCRVYTKEKSEKLENRLTAFLEKIDYILEANDDIVQFSKKINFDVFKMPLADEKLDGMILVDENKGIRRIAVNKSLDLRDSRFVIAHEIAHYITEKEKIGDDGVLLFAKRDRILHGGEKDDLENDMDYMAAAMLVPKEDFVNILKLLRIDLNAIQDHTEETVKRVVNLKVIDLLSNFYTVKQEVIIRRIAEVSYYV